jgi:hypothetical protein
LQGCEVAGGANIKPSPWLYVGGATLVSPDRVSQDLKGKFGGLKSQNCEVARFSGPQRKIYVGADFSIGK